MSRKVTPLAALVICFFAGGCPETPSQVGSHHVGVVSVTRWDEYKDALQPQFNLSANDALTNAVPDTLQLEQTISNSFQAGLALKLAPSSVLPAGFAAGQSGNGLSSGPSTLPASATQPSVVIAPNTLKSDPYLQYLAATALYQEVKLLDRYVHDAAIPEGYRGYVVRLQVSSMPKKRNQPYDTYIDTSLFFTPFDQLRYFSAEEALHELEAQVNPMLAPTTAPTTTSQGPTSTTNTPRLLSLLADPAAIAQLAHTLQLATSQWSAQISAATATAVPHAGNRLNRLNSTSAQIDRIDQLQMQLDPIAGGDDKAAQEAKSLQQSLKAVRNRLEQQRQQLNGLSERIPIIIPLLVTDEVEAALASRRADDLQQLTFALSAAYAGIGGSVDLQNIQRAMRSAVGRDYNSLFSVARLNDNTVRVRIGARQTGSVSSDKKATDQAENYEMTTQNHSLSLLVLVPEDAVKSAPLSIYFGTHRQLANVADGAPLVADKVDNKALRKLLTKEFHELYAQIHPSGSNPIGRSGTPSSEEEVLFNANRAAQSGDYTGFLEALFPSDPLDSLGHPGEVNHLWLEMTEKKIGSDFDGGSFVVPSYPDGAQPIKDQTVIALDDGTQTTMSVPGDLSDWDTRTLSASWTIVTGAANISLGASSMTVNQNSLSLAFPSLKAASIVAASSGTLTVNGTKKQRLQNQNATTEVNAIVAAINRAPVLYAVKGAAAAKDMAASFSLLLDHLTPSGQDHKDTATITITFSPEFKAWLASQGIADGAAIDPTKIDQAKLAPQLTVNNAKVVETDFPATKVPLVPIVPATPNVYWLTKAGRFDLTLTGLGPGKKVTFTLKAPNDQFKGPDPITVDVTSGTP